MSELKPCPFCGSEADYGEIGDDWNPPHPDQGGHFVQCRNAMCAASTMLRFACGDDPKPLLAEHWNRRVVKKVCHVCETPTYMACADCRMNFNAVVYVCENPACCDEHARKCWGDKL